MQIIRMIKIAAYRSIRYFSTNPATPAIAPLPSRAIFFMISGRMYSTVAEITEPRILPRPPKTTNTRILIDSL